MKTRVNGKGAGLKGLKGAAQAKKAGWALLLGTVPEDVGSHWFVGLHRYAESGPRSGGVLTGQDERTSFSKSRHPDSRGVLRDYTCP